MKINNKLMDGSKLLFGAHRGDRVHYPENTIIAMKAAADLGCDIIEIDIRMTKDGHLVVIHDRDVERTTNGHGFVDEMTLEEVKALDAGSWMGEEFVGTQIPTVEEALEYISKSHLLVNWELKEYPKDFGEERAFACADKLVELLERYDMTERSMMNSFSERVLEHIADTYPGKFVIHGWIKYKNPKDFAIKPVETFFDWAAIWNKTDDHLAGFQEDYDYAKDHDILTCIMVPDTEEMYREAISMGCRMFTSDDPVIGMEIMKKIGER